MKKGVIEYRYLATSERKEKNHTIKFNGWWQYIKAMYKVYKEYPDVILIHKS